VKFKNAITEHLFSLFIPLLHLLHLLLYRKFSLVHGIINPFLQKADPRIYTIKAWAGTSESPRYHTLQEVFSVVFTDHGTPESPWQESLPPSSRPAQIMES